MIEENLIKKVLNDNNYPNYSIQVPKGIRYLSNWKEFDLFPFPHILDKKIPGCGFTEYCLTNDQNVVLCSPRKMLLENKFDQHKEDVFYVVNKFEKYLNVDKDISKVSRLAPKDKLTEEELKQIEEEKKLFYKKLKSDINIYITNMTLQNKPFKILVTYDSFYIVKNILKELGLTDYQTIIDEMQSLFVDAAFKSTTENSFIRELSDINRACFVSATPMIEKYLRSIPTFKNLPYYELDWASDDPGRVQKPNLIVKKSRSVTTSTKEIIEKYLSGNFEKRFIKDQTTGNINMIESKEAVFYLNSVNNIFNIIKNMGLKPDQVNILCADTPENNRRLRRKLGKKFSIGKVPLKGDPHKMFTFCTRTVYLGADFYSLCARTFILSDANIKTLAVDISLDLPQILGRQRLIENPWKDEAEFYYKTICDGKVVTKDLFDNELRKKEKETNNLLSAYLTSMGQEVKDDLAKNYEVIARANNYKDNYIAVDIIHNIDGSSTMSPIFNQLVSIAEQRAFDIQQIDYADRFSVFSSIKREKLGMEDQDKIIEFFRIYETLETRYQKLRYLCEYNCNESFRLELFNQVKEKHFKEYYLALGLPGLKKFQYNTGKINEYLGKITFNKDVLLADIYKEFVVGNLYSAKELKQKLTEIYDSCGYKKTPVATDLNNYFELKRTKTMVNGVRVNCIKIIKRK